VSLLLLRCSRFVVLAAAALASLLSPPLPSLRCTRRRSPRFIALAAAALAASQSLALAFALQLLAPLIVSPAALRDVSSASSARDSLPLALVIPAFGHGTLLLSSEGVPLGALSPLLSPSLFDVALLLTRIPALQLLTAPL